MRGGWLPAACAGLMVAAAVAAAADGPAGREEERGTGWTGTVTAAAEAEGCSPVTLKPAGIGVDGDAVPGILEVHRELMMAVIGAGSRHGIRAGARFAVVRGEGTIAELQVVDVRERIAGAVILSVQPGMLPEPADRLAGITGTVK